MVDSFGVTSSGDLQLVMRNSGSSSVEINSISVTDDSGDTASFSDGESISVSETGSVSLSGVSQSNSASKLDVRVNYDAGGLSDLEVEGSISGGFDVFSGPSASINANNSDPVTGENIEFDASGSTSDDGSITSYSWDLNGDGSYEKSGETVTHSYGSTGTYIVELKVTDDNGLNSTDSASVDVRAPNLADSVTYEQVSYDNPGGNAVSASLSNDGEVGLLGVRACGWSCYNGSGYVLDLTDPNNPVVSNIDETPSDPVQTVSLSGSGHTGLLGSDNETAYVLDLSDPSNPGVTEVTAISILPDISDIGSNGEVGLLVSEYDSTGYVLDLSDPSNPAVEEINNPSGNIFSAQISSDGSVGLLGSGDNSGYVLDLSDPSNPVVTEVSATSDNINIVDLSGDGSVGFLEKSDSSVYVLDLSNPSDPGLTERPYSGAPNSMELSEDGTVGIIGSYDSPADLYY